MKSSIFCDFQNLLAFSDEQTWYALLVLINLLPSHCTKTKKRCSAVDLMDLFVDFKPVSTNKKKKPLFQP